MSLADVTSGGVGLLFGEEHFVTHSNKTCIVALSALWSLNRNQRASTSFVSTAITEYLHRMISPLREELQLFNIKNVIFS